MNTSWVRAWASSTPRARKEPSTAGRTDRVHCFVVCKGHEPQRVGAHNSSSLSLADAKKVCPFRLLLGCGPRKSSGRTPEPFKRRDPLRFQTRAGSRPTAGIYLSCWGSSTDGWAGMAGVAGHAGRPGTAGVAGTGGRRRWRGRVASPAAPLTLAPPLTVAPSLCQNVDGRLRRQPSVPSTVGVGVGPWQSHQSTVPPELRGRPTAGFAGSVRGGRNRRDSRRGGRSVVHFSLLGAGDLGRVGQSDAGETSDCQNGGADSDLGGLANTLHNRHTSFVFLVEGGLRPHGGSRQPALVQEGWPAPDGGRGAGRPALTVEGQPVSGGGSNTPAALTKE